MAVKECSNCGGQGVDPSDEGNGSTLCAVCGGSGVIYPEPIRIELEEEELEIIKASLRLLLKMGSKTFQDGVLEYPMTMDEGYQKFLMKAAELYKGLVFSS